jgi:hypothetical protein
MKGLRGVLLALIAVGVLSTGPVALAGGTNGGNGGGNNDGKITICHATGSATNPFVEITISENAVEAHRNHQNGEDIIPAPLGGCPKEEDHCKDDCCKDDCCKDECCKDECCKDECCKDDGH